MLERMSTYDLFRWAEQQFDDRDYYGAVETLERLQRVISTEADTVGGNVDGLGTRAVDELLVRAYFHAGLLAKTEAAARALLERAPDNAYAALLLGRTLQRLSRPDEADRLLARAAALGATP